MLVASGPTSPSEYYSWEDEHQSNNHIKYDNLLALLVEITLLAFPGRDISYVSSIEQR